MIVIVLRVFIFIHVFLGTMLSFDSYKNDKSGPIFQLDLLVSTYREMFSSLKLLPLGKRENKGQPPPLPPLPPPDLLLSVEMDVSSGDARL